MEKTELYQVSKNYNTKVEFNLASDVYVNRAGEVFEIKKGKLVKLNQAKNNGYRSVSVKCDDEKVHNLRVNMLVYSGVSGKKLELSSAVHHKNGNRADNRFENLELTTLSQNLSYFFKNPVENLEAVEAMQYKIDKDILTNPQLEIWKFNEKYNLSVSSKGRVKHAGKLLKQAQNGKFKNNKIVAIYNSETKKTSSVSVAKLMVETFVKLKDEKYKTLLIDSEAGLEIGNLFVVYSKKSSANK